VNLGQRDTTWGGTKVPFVFCWSTEPCPGLGLKGPVSQGGEPSTLPQRAALIPNALQPPHWAVHFLSYVTQAGPELLGSSDLPPQPSKWLGQQVCHCVGSQGF
jgi:hypothetical protein